MRRTWVSSIPASSCVPCNSGCACSGEITGTDDKVALCDKGCLHERLKL